MKVSDFNQGTVFEIVPWFIFIKFDWVLIFS
jgi:hypothetical protein